MRCLVTGAAGFIGSEIVRELIKKGYAVRALLRPGEDDANINGLKVEIYYGDVRDKAAIAKAMDGIDFVFHTASLYSSTYWYNPRPKLIYEINVEGARNVCQAALEAGVKKLIYTGSTASIGCVKNQPTNEQCEFNLLASRSHYEKSKALAEKIVLSFHEKGLSVVAMNPSFLIGPRDSRPSPTGELIVKFMNRRYPAYFDAPLSLSDLTGTAQGHLLALEKGQTGQRYILTSDQQLTVEQFFQMLERITNIPKPPLKIPLFVLRLFAMINEVLLGLIQLLGIGRRWRPLISYEVVRYFTQQCLYDPNKAKTELGFSPQPLEQAIRASTDWYVKNGYIKKSSCKKYLEQIKK